MEDSIDDTEEDKIRKEEKLKRLAILKKWRMIYFIKKVLIKKVKRFKF